MSSDAALSVRALGKSYRIQSAVARPTTMAEAALERAKHPLRRAHRDNFWALSDVSFDVAPGEAIGVIGRNGAGKSTLLKILSRITEPTVGEVRVRGRVGCLLEVGTGFHPELTGRENIYLNGAILGMKRSEITRHFDGIVEFSGVARFLDVPVKRYSSGMSVRLAFAVAAHLEPEILLVDEVLAVGDAEFQRRCLGKMNDVVQEDDRTVLFVSHNMAAIEALCSRCIVLDAGRVLFDGPPVDAVSKYLASVSDSESGEWGDFDLTVRPERDRDRWEHLILRRLRLMGPGFEAVGSVRMGDPLNVVVEVDGLNELTGAFLGLEIRSELDQPLATFHSNMKPARRSHERGRREEVVFELGALPLMPGRYWIGLGIWDPNRNWLADRIERAASFEVLSANVYGSGYEVKAQEGAMFVDFQWEVRPVAPRVSRSREQARELKASPVE